MKGQSIHPGQSVPAAGWVVRVVDGYRTPVFHWLGHEADAREYADRQVRGGLRIARRWGTCGRFVSDVRCALWPVRDGERVTKATPPAAVLVWYYPERVTA